MPINLTSANPVAECWALCNATADCFAWRCTNFEKPNCLHPPYWTLSLPVCFLVSGDENVNCHTNSPDDTCFTSGKSARTESFSYGGSSACSPCAASTAFVSFQAGCQPTIPKYSSPTDTVFFFSGSQAEGVGAFAVTGTREGISYVVDTFGNENGAMSIIAGTMLKTAELSTLPTGGAARTISAYVRCPAPQPGTQSVGLFAFSNGSAQLESGSARLLVYGNVTGGVSGLSPPPCLDCFRSNTTSYAGNGTTGFADGASNAMFGPRMGPIALDSADNIFLADGRSRIRRISAAGTVSTLAGCVNETSIDGVGSSACFAYPWGICLSADESAVFVTSARSVEGGACIRHVSVDSGKVLTVAGRCNTSGFADGVGDDARFGSAAYCIISDSHGTLYMCDTSNEEVRVLSPTSTSDYNVTTLVPSYYPQETWELQALALDAAEETLFILDQHRGYSYIYTLRITDGALSQLIQIKMTLGINIAFHALTSRLFVTDWGDFDLQIAGRVIVLDVNTRDLTTIAGAWNWLGGETNSAFQDGYGASARFANPNGIAVHRNNGTTIYLSDDHNNRMRKIAWPVGKANSIDTRIVVPGLCEGTGQRWHHFAMKQEPADGPLEKGSTALFVDGKKVLPVQTVMPDLSTSALQLGGTLPPATPFSDVASVPFTGAISDLRIFDRALSDAEILALMRPSLPELPDRFMTPSTFSSSYRVYRFECKPGFAGPVIEYSISDETNSWAWSLPRGTKCDLPATASGAGGALNTAGIAAVVMIVLLIIGMMLYVTLMRLRMQRQIEQLTAKTTLASRAMDRARLLALQATP